MYCFYVLVNSEFILFCVAKYLPKYYKCTHVRFLMDVINVKCEMQLYLHKDYTKVEANIILQHNAVKWKKMEFDAQPLNFIEFSPPGCHLFCSVQHVTVYTWILLQSTLCLSFVS